MANGSSTGTAPIEGRAGSWKRRLKIGDLLVVIGVLSVDLAWLRASVRDQFVALFSLLGLLVIMVGFVWRYVPRRWDRACYAAALILYLFFLGIYIMSMSPLLSGRLWMDRGVQ
jgi:hypothetical protein